MIDYQKEPRRLKIQALFIGAMVLLVLIFGFKEAAFPQDNRGASFLGICSPEFPCDKSFKSFQFASKIRSGWLDNTFAPGCECGVKLLKLPKPKLVRIQVLNGPCLRNRRCGPYEIFAGETIESAERKILNNNPDFMNKYQARLERIKLQLSKGQNTECLISPCLECDFSKPARKKLLAIAGSVLPKCGLVDNPLVDSCLPGYFCEKHGDKPTKPIALTDLDGTDFYAIGDQTEYGRNYPNAIANLAWSYCLNGNSESGNFIDPRQRKEFCTDREFLSFQSWARPDALDSDPIDSRDKANCSVMFAPRDGVKKDFLFKLGDGRPFSIALFPVRFNQVFRSVVITKAGKVVDTGKFRGKYTEDKSNRLIYDFSKHPSSLPKSVVLHADGNCWFLNTPQFRID